MTATLFSPGYFHRWGRRAAAFIQNEWTLIAYGGICHSFSLTLTLGEHDPSLNYSPERTYLLLVRSALSEPRRAHQIGFCLPCGYERAQEFVCHPVNKCTHTSGCGNLGEEMKFRRLHSGMHRSHQQAA